MKTSIFLQAYTILLQTINNLKLIRRIGYRFSAFYIAKWTFEHYLTIKKYQKIHKYQIGSVAGNFLLLTGFDKHVSSIFFMKNSNTDNIIGMTYFFKDNLGMHSVEYDENVDLLFDINTSLPDILYSLITDSKRLYRKAAAEKFSVEIETDCLKDRLQALYDDESYDKESIYLSYGGDKPSLNLEFKTPMIKDPGSIISIVRHINENFEILNLNYYIFCYFKPTISYVCVCKFDRDDLNNGMIPLNPIYNGTIV